MRISFQDQLDRTETALQEEGELVLRALRGSMNAFWEQDTELSDEVIAFDDQIDGIYFNIQGGIQALLAQQTPVAGDLRLVLALLHSNLHLERMGDYCVTIAKIVKLASEFEPEPALVDAFADMGARAEGMIRVALDAFEARDVEAAETLVDLDELIDRANRRVVGQVLALGSDPERLEWGLRMITVSRCLERIGDHAVDIGEQIAYLVTGEFREFTDASRRPDSPRAERYAPSASIGSSGSTGSLHSRETSALIAVAKTSRCGAYAGEKSTAPLSSRTTYRPGPVGRRSTPVRSAPIAAAAAIASSHAAGDGSVGTRVAPSATFVRHSPGCGTRLIAPITSPPATTRRRSWPSGGTSSCTTAPEAANHARDFRVESARR